MPLAERRDKFAVSERRRLAVEALEKLALKFFWWKSLRQRGEDHCSRGVEHT